MARAWTHPLRTVRVRITLAAVLVTAVAVGTAGWLLVRSVEDAQIRDLRGEVGDYLDEVTDRLREGQAPADAVRNTDAAAPMGAVTVTDEDGDVVASFPEPVVEEEDEAELDLGGLLGQGDEPMPTPTERITRSVELPGGDLTLAAETPVDQVARNIDVLTGRLAVGLPALVALVGMIAWVLVGRALRPVEAIRAEVERITGSTMHRRVPEPPANDEVGRLARTMNTMLVRLETTATRQRRFVSDASHELRSPVAAIRAGLEVGRGKTDPAAWRALVDDLLAEESRLEGLLDDLLLLAAHDENGTVPAPARSVDLTELTEAEARRPRRVPVELVYPAGAGEQVVVAGSPDHLARAVSNIVDNAARHATSAVRITLRRDNGTAQILVDDDGPGIPEADRTRVFERFTRLDAGRAREAGGTGLGLAVARAIVTTHHGSIAATASPLGGARLTTTLPTADLG